MPSAKPKATTKKTRREERVAAEAASYAKTADALHGGNYTNNLGDMDDIARRCYEATEQALGVPEYNVTYGIVGNLAEIADADLKARAEAAQGTYQPPPSTS